MHLSLAKYAGHTSADVTYHLIVSGTTQGRAGVQAYSICTLHMHLQHDGQQKSTNEYACTQLPGLIKMRCTNYKFSLPCTAPQPIFGQLGREGA